MLLTHLAVLFLMSALCALLAPVLLLFADVELRFRPRVCGGHETQGVPLVELVRLVFIDGAVDMSHVLLAQSLPGEPASSTGEGCPGCCGTPALPRRLSRRVGVRGKLHGNPGHRPKER